MKHNIIYLCTYLDEELSARFGLNYAPAGLKKKQCIVRALANHHVEIVFVSAFTRFMGRVFRGFSSNKDSTTIHVPWFTTIAFLNYLLNPVFVFLKILKLNRKQKVDSLILYNCVYENTVPALLAKKLLGIRVIVQYEDGWVVENHGIKNVLFRISHKTALKISDGLIANSKNFLELFPKNNFLLFRGSVSHLSDSMGFSKKTERGKLNFVFASSIDKVRGASLLCDLLLHLNDNDLIDKIKFTITGNVKDDTGRQLEVAVAAYLAKGGIVDYKGFVSEETLRGVYHEADVFIALQDPSLPFSKYCFPSKLFEYYFYNIPIISTKVSDIAGVFPNLLFIDCNVQSLEDKIRNCVANTHEIMVANEGNRDFIKANFSNDRIRKDMDRFLEGLN